MSLWRGRTLDTAIHTYSDGKIMYEDDITVLLVLKLLFVFLTFRYLYLYWAFEINSINAFRNYRGQPKKLSYITLAVKFWNYWNYYILHINNHFKVAYTCWIPWKYLVIFSRRWFSEYFLLNRRNSCILCRLKLSTTNEINT